MKGLIFDGQIKRREMGRGKENYNSQLVQEFSVTRWPVCLLNFGHLQQWKFTPWHLKFAKLMLKICHIKVKILPKTKWTYSKFEHFTILLLLANSRHRTQHCLHRVHPGPWRTATDIWDMVRDYLAVISLQHFLPKLTSSTAML